MLVHLHIPKTAGTSFLDLLRLNYPMLYRVKNSGGWRKSHVPATADCVSGHMPYGCLNIEQSEYVTFLRHPVDRLMSFYWYVQHRGKENRWYEKIGHMTLDEYLVSDAHDNEIVRFLSGVGEFDIPMTADHLQTAKRNLLDFAFVGLKETFANDVQSIANKFKWKNVPDKLPYRLKSSNRGHLHLRPDILEKSLQREKLDWELYKFVELTKKS